MSTITGPLVRGVVSATTTAAPLSATPKPLVRGVNVKSLSTNGAIVYVGGSDVSAANGYELVAGQSVQVSADKLGDIYVISASGTQSVRFIGG